MRRPQPKVAYVVSACVGAAFAAFGTACAMVWGFEDPLDPQSSPALVGDGSIAEGRAPEDCKKPPDETNGIFVVGAPPDSGTTTVENPQCGSKDVPCIHIQTGLDRAKQLGDRTIVYVISGIYTESIKIDFPITLQGGWNALKTGSSYEYARACGSAPGTAVTIQAPDGETTAVTISADKVTLDDLSIKTPLTTDPATSLYGVRVVGSSSNPQVTLQDVFVSSGAGGAGIPGTAGPAGDAGTGMCDPAWVPPDAGDAAVAPEGDGGHVGDSPSMPSFTMDGIEPAKGGSGATGQKGYNGATPASPSPVTCYGSCTPPATLGPCTGGMSTMATGMPGAAGCGGFGGAGGTGATGGGSSVALYVWSANALVIRGGLSAGPGGAGALGGSGGAGGAGALGKNGTDSSSCVVDCGNGVVIVGCNAQVQGTSKGTSGTRGGPGGPGGLGGAGAGGDSFAYVQASGGVVTIMDPNSTSLVFGMPGAGVDGGAPGTAAVKGGL